ncbi:MAG: polysaccharide biosynthesis C-terminal domain-containing protein [Clostridia bacterium]|nr:polysaccharide biosynthesis C-terminal domain-containing protein [Clostridia bacterium]
MRKAKQFIINGLAVSGVALFLRFVGMAFNVYVSSVLGAQGMGLLSLVNSVYTLALTLASSGINLTCTRLCAQALEQKRGKEARRALFGCVLYSLLFGFFSMFLLLGLSKPIAFGVLGEARTEGYLRVLALSLPATALSSCLAGYFTAIRKVSRSAITSILSQGVKIALTVFLVSLFGGGSGGVGAILLASCLSEILGALLSALLCIPDLKGELRPVGSALPHLPARICGIALPVAFAAWVRSALVSAEHVLIPKGLIKYGAGSDSALATYGMMHGMALPVIFFPTAILSSFTSLLIPEISRFHAENKQEEISASASRMLRITLLYSIACAAILLFFAEPFGVALYRSLPTGKMIALFAPLIPVMYLDTAADSVLKGMGEQVYCMKINIIDAAISLILVYFLVPRIGVAGYVLTVFLSECFNTVFSILRLCKKIKLSLPLLSSLILPVLCAIGAAFPAKGLYAPLSTLPAFLSLPLACLVFLAFYCFLLSVTGAFSKNDKRYFKRLLTGK